jgi:NAD(P)-dependent dehydrogenase (short-subunit alcohol dehydrogenase family)
MTNPGSTRRAVVTGGSSGIGRAAARQLAEAGWEVAIGYNSDRTSALAVLDDIQRAGGAGTVFGLDARDPDDALRRFEAVVANLGGIEALVNSAGVNRRELGVDESTAGLRSVLDINASTPIALAGAAARHMRVKGGSIINITSVHERTPIVGGTSYCASKAALGAATRVLALENARLGISVNAVAPGETATPMNGVPSGVSADQIVRPAIPAGRPASPDEIAALVVFLASPTSRYITGQSIVVDGGMDLTAAVENAKYANHPQRDDGK